MNAIQELEQNILGCVLFEPDACTEAYERLKPEHFAEPAHRLIWEEIMRVRGAGVTPDGGLLDSKLSAGPTYEAVGGRRYLHDLIDKASLLPLRGHVEAVVDASMRRAIAELTDHARTCEGSAGDVLAMLERGAADIARRCGSETVGVPVGFDALENLEAAWEGQFRGLSTGLDCLDRITGGMQPDDVWIFGGRTSMGKSVILPCIGRGVAEQGRGVLMFSLEMSRRAVQARMAADIAYDRGLVPYGGDGGNVEFSDLINGRGTSQQRDRARSAARKLASLPMVLNDRGGLNLEQIISLSRRQVRAWERAHVEPGCIIIDHLGLVQSSIMRDSKAAERADVVDRLKEAARLIGCPIIAAAQVNRGPEGRQDKRPTMGDLNWSGSIEQIADFVGLLYRDAYYLERSPVEEDQAKAVGLRNELEIIVPKNRSGPTCTLKAHVEIACSAIRDEEDHTHGRRFG
ncbi:DnaB-like helicase C-terminal domain-containing protein [uncultured Brevundimonas sp.]|uniref:replicative DNA helicase n=1 Tax=uncultured Brevundimonas sp. TaxID=213418 RepID=UPI0025CD63C2|nr:DnaB-like helicase C-terminal domain-containing protein [uncultured Brevundimonas sp.]